MQNGVYYSAAGGLGKTWLLRKIILENAGDPVRIVLPIIDFANTKNQSLHGLQRSIEERLDRPELFSVYDRLTDEAEMLRALGDQANPGALTNLAMRANRAFIRACKRAAAGREVVLLFDTFERVQQRDVGRWLVADCLPQVTELIVAVAGRPVSAASSTITARMPDSFVAFDLGGLLPTQVAYQVHRRWSEADDLTIKQISRRTRGAPLLVDLILDLPDGEREAFVNELCRLPEKQTIQDVPGLQQRLLAEFAGPVNARCRLIWAMASFRRRFDLPLLDYLMTHAKVYFPANDYHAVLADLSYLTYVKDHPETANHLLHDEIGRMVADLVLPAVGWPPDELKRLVVDGYYPAAIQKAEEARDWQLAKQFRAEQLGYLLDDDLEIGLARYESCRQEIETGHDYDFEELVWGEVREHIERFPAEAAAIWERRGLWLRRHSLFTKAETHYAEGIQRALSGQAAFAAVETDFRQTLGFVLMRQGEFDRARAEFDAVRALIPQTAYEQLSEIENNLGQEAQAAGRWDQALVHFANCLRAATLADAPGYKAGARLHRAEIYAMQGYYSQAVDEGKTALSLLKDLDDDPDNIQRTIYAHLHLGIALRHSKQFDEAEKAYQTSLAIAQAHHNVEAIARALQQLGINAHLRGRAVRRKLTEQTLPGRHLEDTTVRQQDFQTACRSQWQAWQWLEQALMLALESDWRKSIAEAYNRLAKLYRELKRLDDIANLTMTDLQPLPELLLLRDRAHSLPMTLSEEDEGQALAVTPFTEFAWLDRSDRLFELSAQVANEVNDFHRALDSLMELFGNLIEQRDEDRVIWVIRRINQLKGVVYQEKIFGAMTHIGQGQLAFRRGQRDAALELYKVAFAETARESSVPLYFLLDRLRDLEWHMRELGRDEALQWCDALQEHWQVEGVIFQRPEMLDTLERMRSETLKRPSESNP